MARKEKKYHLIYKTTNILTGRYYYGMHSTDNLDDGYLGSGKRLKYSINKYGKDVHKREIVEFCSNRELLNNKEKEVITLNEIGKKDCMNLIVGGQGGDGGLSNVSPEKIQNIRKGASDFMNRLWKDPKFIEGHKQRTIEILKKRHQRGEVKYDTFTGKKHSEETKIKMSNLKRGKGVGNNNSQFGTCWITKNGNDKKIKKEYLQEYLSEGWIKGRYVRVF
jgi:hypothetical protein